MPLGWEWGLKNYLWRVQPGTQGHQEIKVHHLRDVGVDRRRRVVHYTAGQIVQHGRRRRRDKEGAVHRSDQSGVSCSMISAKRLNSCCCCGCCSRFCVCQCDQIWRNFTNFGKIFKVLGNFSRVYVFFGKILGQLFHIYFTLGQILIDVNGQLLKNNLAIWSHFGQSHPIGWKAFWIVWISRNGCCNQK